MGFGNGIVYFMDNGDGDLYRYDASNDTSTSTNSNEVSSTAENTMTNSSNTDGAACGVGDPASSSGDLVVSDPYQGTCSGGQSDVRVDVTAYQATMYYDLQRRVNTGSGWSSWVTTLNGQSLSAGSTHIFGDGYIVDSGTQVQFRYREGTSNPSSGDYIEVSDSSDPNNVQPSRDHTGMTLSLTVSCDPSAVALTASQSLGACTAGSKTSTLSLYNNSGSTAYVTAEYKIDSGSWTAHTSAEEADNLTITNGETNTSLTASVNDGSSIQWRYKSSDTSGNWTGLSYVTSSDMNSSTVVCSNPVSFSISQALGTCSGGSNTSTLTITNNESSASHFYVEYKIDSGYIQCKFKLYSKWFILK